MLLKPLVLPFFALTLATQQPSGVDFLDTGIVFTGPVRFEREKDSTTHFMLTVANSSFVIRVDTERAFATANTSMSYQWAQKLSAARSASFRIADMREMVPETTIRSDLLDMLLCFRPAPVERTNEYIIYTIQCIAFDEQRRIRNATGGLIYEVDFMVGVPNHSPADTFLSRPRENIYVRLEP